MNSDITFRTQQHYDYDHPFWMLPFQPLSTNQESELKYFLESIKEKNINFELTEDANPMESISLMTN